MSRPQNKHIYSSKLKHSQPLRVSHQSSISTPKSIIPSQNSSINSETSNRLSTLSIASGSLTSLNKSLDGKSQISLISQSLSTNTSSNKLINNNKWINEIDSRKGSVMYIETLPPKYFHRQSTIRRSNLSSSSNSSHIPSFYHQLPGFGISPSIEQKSKGKLNQLFPNYTLGRQKKLSQDKPKIFKYQRASAVSLDESHMTALLNTSKPLNADTQKQRRNSEFNLKFPHNNTVPDHFIPSFVQLDLENMKFNTSTNILTQLGIIISQPSLKAYRSFDNLLNGTATSKGQTDNNNLLTIEHIQPNSTAQLCGKLKADDVIINIDGIPVNNDNINDVIDNMTKHKKINISILRPSAINNDHNTNLQDLPELSVSNNANIKIEQLIKLITRQYSLLSKQELPPCCVLYLDINNSDISCNSNCKDIIFQFPSKCHFEEVNCIISLRGMLYTLCDVTQLIANSYGNLCKVQLESGQVMSIAYKIFENKQILIMAVPETADLNKYFAIIFENLINQFTFIYGSPIEAFTNRKQNDEISHLCELFFSNLFNLFGFNYSPSHYNGSWGVHTLKLNPSLHAEIATYLNELDAMDLNDQPEVKFMQRPYQSVGAFMFYRGYLVISHLPDDHIRNIGDFMNAYSLLQLCKDYSVGQIVIWKEVYPFIPSFNENHINVKSDHKPQPKLNSGRYFLLLVGMGHTLIGQLLISGPLISRVLEHPPPDPLLVDRIKEILLEIDNNSLLSDLKDRCLGNIQKPQITNPLNIGSVAKSYEREKTVINRNFRGSMGSLRTSGDSSDSDCSVSVRSISRNSINIFDTNHYNDDIFITNGTHNYLFCYLVTNLFTGIYIAPPINNGDNTSLTMQRLSVEIHDRFQSACLIIHNKFCSQVIHAKTNTEGAHAHRKHKSNTIAADTKNRNIEEYGLLIEIDLPTHKQNKDEAKCKFWVVGRNIFRCGKPHEVYICFQESSLPQSIVEMSFRLLQGHCL